MIVVVSNKCQAKIPSVDQLILYRRGRLKIAKVALCLKMQNTEIYEFLCLASKCKLRGHRDSKVSDRSREF
jgi:hypothetical protein